MSKLKSTLAATLLTLVLAFPALAGNIGTPGGTPPPPPAPATSGDVDSTGSPAPGDMGSLGLSSELVDILMAVLFLI